MTDEQFIETGPGHAQDRLPPAHRARDEPGRHELERPRSLFIVPVDVQVMYTRVYTPMYNRKTLFFPRMPFSSISLSFLPVLSIAPEIAEPGPGRAIAACFGFTPPVDVHLSGKKRGPASIPGFASTRPIPCCTSPCTSAVHRSPR